MGDFISDGGIANPIWKTAPLEVREVLRVLYNQAHDIEYFHAGDRVDFPGVVGSVLPFNSWEVRPTDVRITNVSPWRLSDQDDDPMYVIAEMLSMFGNGVHDYASDLSNRLGWNVVSPHFGVGLTTEFDLANYLDGAGLKSFGSDVVMVCPVLPETRDFTPHEIKKITKAAGDFADAETILDMMSVVGDSVRPSVNTYILEMASFQGRFGVGHGAEM